MPAERGYWRGVEGLTRSLGMDPSVTEIRTALRWRSFLDTEVASRRFPNPEPFEVWVRQGARP
ncbi:MAG TPA: hypothetical protein VIM86_07195 [Thermodesulfobacteriota bacterium]